MSDADRVATSPNFATFGDDVATLVSEGNQTGAHLLLHGIQVAAGQGRGYGVVSRNSRATWREATYLDGEISLQQAADTHDDSDWLVPNRHYTDARGTASYSLLDASSELRNAAANSKGRTAGRESRQQLEREAWLTQGLAQTLLARTTILQGVQEELERHRGAEHSYSTARQQLANAAFCVADALHVSNAVHRIDVATAAARNEALLGSRWGEQLQRLKVQVALGGLMLRPGQRDQLAKAQAIVEARTFRSGDREDALSSVRAHP